MTTGLMRRTPLKRGAGLVRGAGRLARTRLQPTSQRRRDEADAYTEAKAAVWVRDQGRCQAVSLLPDVACAGPIDPHHLRVLSQGGQRCDPGNMRLLCRHHHEWTHGHTRAARVLGLLR